MNQLLKQQIICNLHIIAVESDGDKIQLTAFDAQNNAAHTNTIEVGDGNGKKYRMVFLTENLRMITGTYDVQGSFKGLAFFKNKNQEIQYWVATDPNTQKENNMSMIWLTNAKNQGKVALNTEHIVIFLKQMMANLQTKLLLV